MAVSIKVIPYNIAADIRYHAIRVNKPMRLRVVVTRLQEVESGFGIVIIASVPYRVDVSDMGRVGSELTSALLPLVIYSSSPHGP